MPEFTVTEYRWVLADYPFTVHAESAGEAFLKVATEPDPLPDRASRVEWEIWRPFNWSVEGPAILDSDSWIDTEPTGRLFVSRRGFIGVRDPDA